MMLSSNFSQTQLCLSLWWAPFVERNAPNISCPSVWKPQVILRLASELCTNTYLLTRHCLCAFYAVCTPLKIIDAPWIVASRNSPNPLTATHCTLLRKEPNGWCWTQIYCLSQPIVWNVGASCGYPMDNLYCLLEKCGSYMYVPTVYVAGQRGGLQTEGIRHI